MKIKYIITITILITLFIIGSLYFGYQYEQSRNQDAYEQGYTSGLLYTQSSGNLAYVDNSSGEVKLSEISLEQVCNNLNKQEVNQNG